MKTPSRLNRRAFKYAYGHTRWSKIHVVRCTLSGKDCKEFEREWLRQGWNTSASLMPAEANLKVERSVSMLTADLMDISLSIAKPSRSAASLEFCEQSPEEYAAARMGLQYPKRVEADPHAESAAKFFSDVHGYQQIPKEEMDALVMAVRKQNETIKVSLFETHKPEE